MFLLTVTSFTYILLYFKRARAEPRAADFRFPEVSGPAAEAAGCWCIRLLCPEPGQRKAYAVTGGHGLGCYADEEVVLAAVGTRCSERLRGAAGWRSAWTLGTSTESVKRWRTRRRLKGVLSGCLALKSCPIPFVLLSSSGPVVHAPVDRS